MASATLALPSYPSAIEPTSPHPGLARSASPILPLTAFGVGDRDIPASAHALLLLLHDRGPLTHRDLVDASGLPPRTVRWATKHLRERGLLRGRHSIRDARQQYYFLVPADSAPGAPSASPDPRPLRLGGW